jgi:hypothetical protein
MEEKNNLPKFGLILAAGSLWGIVEFGAGMGLNKCATLMTGAILTGLSFFWLSFIWSITKRLLPVLLIVVIAMLFKWLDALLLHVAWNHGSVLNPMFAFFTAMTGFMVVIILFKKAFARSKLARILVGGGAAMVATALFPLVGFATGNPACTYAATSIPLAIYTAPIAILLAMITVPLGFRAATWLEQEGIQAGRIYAFRQFNRLWSPALLVSCLIIIIVVRLV